MMRVWRLSNVCLSVAYIGPKSRTERPIGRLNWHRGSPRHIWLGHHFQGKKVKGQFAGGGGILWRPPAQFVIIIIPPLLIGGGIKRCFFRTSDVCLPDVWRLSVAYIRPKSRTERPRKTKIGTGVAHVTRDSDTTFKVKGQGYQPLYSPRP